MIQISNTKVGLFEMHSSFFLFYDQCHVRMGGRNEETGEKKVERKAGEREG